MDTGKLLLPDESSYVDAKRRLYMLGVRAGLFWVGLIAFTLGGGANISRRMVRSTIGKNESINTVSQRCLPRY
jgi:hypothetical protein